MTSATPTTVQPDEPGVLVGGHPIGLLVIVAATVWESFALASMKAGLVYYIVDELRVAQKTAIEIYGYTTATIFLMSLVGAGLADRLFGLRRATALGALLMGLGFALLLKPRLLLVALLVVAIGNGLFKPTALAQIGLLYSEQDPRRDRAFNLCYVGMNFGAFVAPLVAGEIALFYGWTWSFVAAAVGMIISVGIYWRGRRHVPEAQRSDAPPVEWAEQHPRQVIAPAVVALVWVGGALFWTAYSQIGSTFALWAEHDVARSIDLFGRSWIVPAAWLQSINPILIILAGPLVNLLWARSGSAAGTRNEIRKMIQGTVLLAGAFAIFSAASVIAARTHSAVSMAVVCLAFVPFTIGELYVAPVGQALFSRVARKGYTSILMAIWILTMMMGYVASGLLGGLWTRMSPGDFFGGIAALALVGAAVFWVARGTAGRT